MALYSYLKSESQSTRNFSVAFPRPFSRISASQGWLSFLFTVFGMILIGNAAIPILNYQIRYAPRFGKILSPLVYENGKVLGSLAVSAKEDEKDYTLLSSWFEEAEGKALAIDPEITHYTISVPRLKIEQASVQIGGEDLKKMLIHYPNTAWPGQLGNTVVIGHSVLPQFFNPESYLTIFSTLHRLKSGDDIFIDFDGIRYRYLVEDLFEVSAEDLSVLEQRYDDRFLTLITCSPPGTYYRRLIVRGRLVAE
ncbi:MAG: sortase [Patescibacteria group bacterium]